MDNPDKLIMVGEDSAVDHIADGVTAFTGHPITTALGTERKSLIRSRTPFGDTTSMKNMTEKYFCTCKRSLKLLFPDH